MLSINLNELKKDLKGYSEQVLDKKEEIIVTDNEREDNKNIIILSLDRYNQLLKDIRNAKYLAKLDIAYEQMMLDEKMEQAIQEVEKND